MGIMSIAGSRGVCIASSGKAKKLCVEVDEGISADVFIRAVRGSGGLGANRVKYVLRQGGKLKNFVRK